MSQSKAKDEIPEESEEKLRAIITGQDLTYEEALEQYWEKRQQAMDAVSESYLSEEDAKEYAETAAVQGVKSGLNKDSRQAGGRGEAERIELITIGHGDIREWGDGDDADEVLYGYAIAQPPDGDMQTATVLVNDGEGGDPHRAKEFFSEPANHCVGWFDVETADHLSDHYMLRTTGETKIKDYEYDDGETEFSKPQLVKGIQSEVEKVSIENIHNNKQQTKPDGYTAAFGGDMRRIEATVVDAVKLDNLNIFSVMDETTPTPETIPDRVQSDEGRSPGLSCFVPDDYFNYGSESVLELYGAVNVDDDGQIYFSTYGVVPILPQDYDAEDLTTDDNNMSGNTTEQDI